MRHALLTLVILAGVFFTGCASSQPIDIDLAEQNQTNIVTTVEGTVSMMDLLDEAKAENPAAPWASKWDEFVRLSHELQAQANAKIAAKVLKRAKEYNPEK